MSGIYKKYKKLNKVEKSLIRKTFFWLLASYFLVRIIPFNWFNHILGVFKKDSSYELNTAQKEKVSQLSISIKRLKKVLPWKTKCFEETIAAKKILEHYHISSTLFLGVKKDSQNKLMAHSWLKVGNNIYFGQKGHKKFSIVGFYT